MHVYINESAYAPSICVFPITAILHMVVTRLIVSFTFHGSLFVLKFIGSSVLQTMRQDLANALAKCRHSPLIGHALQLGLLFVQKTCKIYSKCPLAYMFVID